LLVSLDRGSQAKSLSLCMSGSLSLHLVALGLLIWLVSVPPGMSALEVFPAPSAPAAESGPAPSAPSPPTPV